MTGHFTRPRSQATDIRTHFNLSTGGYTVDIRVPKKGWRARDCKTVRILLRNAYFGFTRSGHRAYVESLKVPCLDKAGNPVLDANGNPKLTGMRNVHAWVFGVESHDEIELDRSWRPARYSADPACFVDVETRQPLPNDRSVDVFLGSRTNLDPKTGLPTQSRYCHGRTPKLLPMMYWRTRD